MTNEEQVRQHHLKAVYQAGWDILGTMMFCECPPGACPLGTELDQLGISEGDLLLALVTGDRTHIGCRI